MGVMVGLGEETHELIEVFCDLAATGCNFSPSASMRPWDVLPRLREEAQARGLEPVA